MLIDLIIYCMVIGFLMLFLSVAAQWLVKAGSSARLLDGKVELLAAISTLEHDIKKACCGPCYWHVAGRGNSVNVDQKLVFKVSSVCFDKTSRLNTRVDSIALNSIDDHYSCGWELKNDQLRRVEGFFCMQSLKWKKRISTSVLSGGIKSIKCKLFVISNIVHGIKVSITRIDGRLISRVIRLRRSINNLP